MPTARLRRLAAELDEAGVRFLASEIRTAAQEAEELLAACGRAIRHGPDCWRRHHACAVRLVESYQGALASLARAPAIARPDFARGADLAPVPRARGAPAADAGTPPVMGRAGSTPSQTGS